VIVGFILPEGLPGSPKNRIRRARASAFDIHESLAERYQRPHQDMDMISHNNPGEEFIKLPFGRAREQDSADTVGHLCVLQPQRAGGGTIQLSIQGRECRTGWRGGGCRLERAR
jgi:hypothetical protein